MIKFKNFIKALTLFSAFRGLFRLSSQIQSVIGYLFTSKV